jgi:hypothetical protein
VPKVISPSRLARFYFHECERYLRYSSVRAEDREREGVPRPVRETRPVAQAILDSGLAWEEEVVEHLLSGHVYLAEGAGEDGKPLSESVIDQATARRLLTSIEPGESVYQPELAVPPRFYERYGLDPDVVHWPPCRPDLVEADATPNGETVLRVIDIKASPGVKLSHRIQATVYSLVLECLLEEWGVRVVRMVRALQNGDAQAGLGVARAVPHDAREAVPGDERSAGQNPQRPRGAPRRSATHKEP